VSPRFVASRPACLNYYHHHRILSFAAQKAGATTAIVEMLLIKFIGAFITFGFVLGELPECPYSAKLKVVNVVNGESYQECNEVQSTSNDPKSDEMICQIPACVRATKDLINVFPEDCQLTTNGIVLTKKQFQNIYSKCSDEEKNSTVFFFVSSVFGFMLLLLIRNIFA
jgi:hypothetical protein